MFNYSTTLERAYSGALPHYLVPSELDHMDHTTNTTFIKIEVPRVDLTASVQRKLPYQHIQEFIKLPPIWLGEPVELTSTHKALNPLVNINSSVLSSGT